MARRAIYTAIFGMYDHLKEMPAVEGVDRICFTDTPHHVTREDWDVRSIMPPTDRKHPQMLAKWFKLFPHLALPDYDETVWIDGSFAPKSKVFSEASFEWLKRSPFSLWSHPGRDCIYPEVIASSQQTRYSGLPFTEQAQAYRDRGHPERGGLYATGCLVRRSHEPILKEIAERWWKECLTHTYQDQISLPVVLRDVGFTPAVFDHRQDSDVWGTFVPHRIIPEHG